MDNKQEPSWVNNRTAFACSTSSPLPSPSSTMSSFPAPFARQDAQGWVRVGTVGNSHGIGSHSLGTSSGNRGHLGMPGHSGGRSAFPRYGAMEGRRRSLDHGWNTQRLAPTLNMDEQDTGVSYEQIHSKSPGVEKSNTYHKEELLRLFKRMDNVPCQIQGEDVGIWSEKCVMPLAFLPMSEEEKILMMAVNSPLVMGFVRDRTAIRGRHTMMGTGRLHRTGRTERSEWIHEGFNHTPQLQRNEEHAPHVTPNLEGNTAKCMAIASSAILSADSSSNSHYYKDNVSADPFSEQMRAGVMDTSIFKKEDTSPMISSTFSQSQSGASGIWSMPNSMMLGSTLASNSVVNNLLPPGFSTHSPEMLIMDKWVYKDPQGEIQGPFTSQQMLSWFESGFFAPNLLVRRDNQRDFEFLGALLQKYEGIPFTMPRHILDLKDELFLQRSFMANRPLVGLSFSTQHLEQPTRSAIDNPFCHVVSNPTVNTRIFDSGLIPRAYLSTLEQGVTNLSLDRPEEFSPSGNSVLQRSDKSRVHELTVPTVQADYTSTQSKESNSSSKMSIENSTMKIPSDAKTVSKELNVIAVGSGSELISADSKSKSPIWSSVASNDKSKLNIVANLQSTGSQISVSQKQSEKAARVHVGQLPQQVANEKFVAAPESNHASKAPSISISTPKNESVKSAWIKSTPRMDPLSLKEIQESEEQKRMEEEKYRRSVPMHTIKSLSQQENLPLNWVQSTVSSVASLSLSEIQHQEEQLQLKNNTLTSPISETNMGRHSLAEALPNTFAQPTTPWQDIATRNAVSLSKIQEEQSKLAQSNKQKTMAALVASKVSRPSSYASTAVSSQHVVSPPQAATSTSSWNSITKPSVSHAIPTKPVAASKSSGFWDIEVQKTNSISMGTPKLSTSTDDLVKWCEKELSSLSSLDVPVFISFLLELQSDAEIRGYINEYLGQVAGLNSRKFTEEFLKRRGFRNRTSTDTSSEEVYEIVTSKKDKRKKTPKIEEA